jgi:hypothetical protein
MKHHYPFQPLGVATRRCSTSGFKQGLLAAATDTVLIAAPAMAAPTVEQQVEQLSKEVDELKREVAEQKSVPAGDGATHIGGYGELHYNSLDSKDEIDFHRRPTTTDSIWASATCSDGGRTGVNAPVRILGKPACNIFAYRSKS